MVHQHIFINMKQMEVWVVNDGGIRSSWYCSRTGKETLNGNGTSESTTVETLSNDWFW